MPIPAGPHNDWPWPLSYIPRRWTAWESDTPPRKLAGTERVEDQPDIPEPGKWVLMWPFYFAFTTRGPGPSGDNGWHFRIGVRYDYADRYYTWPAFTIKRIDSWKY